MHKFIIFGNYTDKGIKNIKESPTRLADAKKLAKEFDGEISLFYLTLGQYDIFLICEFPSDEKAARFCLKIGSLGNVLVAVGGLFFVIAMNKKKKSGKEE